MNHNTLSIEDLPDDPALLQRLNAACGYLELGMAEEALVEVRSLSLFHRGLPAVLHHEIIALIMLHRFESAAEVSRQAILEFPQVSEFYMHAGAALAALKRGEDARALWASAPAPLQKNGLFQLNVACCEYELGDFPQARRHLRRAMRIDPALERVVESEPRLLEILAKS